MIDWRMLPLLGLLYALALIDRTNLGVARIAGMQMDLVRASCACARSTYLTGYRSSVSTLASDTVLQRWSTSLPTSFCEYLAEQPALPPRTLRLTVQQ